MAKILILEDDSKTAKRWQSVLRGAGHEVTLSFTSSEAVAHAGYEDFDVFVVDLRIAIDVAGIKDSGLKFLAQLNRLLKSGDLQRRVIGVSSLMIDNKDSLARQSFRMFDVRYFLAKPFEPKALLAMVDGVLRVDINGA